MSHLEVISHVFLVLVGIVITLPWSSAASQEDNAYYNKLVNGHIDHFQEQITHFQNVWKRSTNSSRLSVKKEDSYKICGPWMFHNETSGECECSDIPYRAVLCDPTVPRTSILDCYCMTYNAERNETELGRCMQGCGKRKDSAVYYELPQNVSDLNDWVCEKSNRTSTLCGACKAGYSPLVYSYNMSCMNCTGMTYNWIKYVAVAYIPLTFFFFFVIIFRFSGTSPLVRGFITLCQGLVSSSLLRAVLPLLENKPYPFQVCVKILSTLCGIWNLDFFRAVLPPICLEISPLQALALDYGIAFYPFILIIITYILISLHSRDVRVVVWWWKPFHKLFHSIRKDWDLEESVIKSFATFFLLSYLKIIHVTVDLMMFIEKYTLPLGNQSYQVKHVLFYDASVEYFKDEHVCLGILAILVGIFIVILPLVFLVIYPMHWFQKCLNACQFQRHSIDMIVNCYQGYYKDGTNGTRDYRFFSIAYFFPQLILIILYAFCKSMFFYPIAALISNIIMFTILTVRPYKEQFKAYNLIDSFMLLILSSIFSAIAAADIADIKAVYFITISYVCVTIFILIPLAYFVGLIIWWLFIKKRIKDKLVCCVRAQEVRPRTESCDANELLDRLDINNYQLMDL